jgi:hypothetical protein
MSFQTIYYINYASTLIKCLLFTKMYIYMWLLWGHYQWRIRWKNRRGKGALTGFYFSKFCYNNLIQMGYLTRLTIYGYLRNPARTILSYLLINFWLIVLKFCKFFHKSVLNKIFFFFFYNLSLKDLIRSEIAETKIRSALQKVENSLVVNFC